MVQGEPDPGVDVRNPVDSLELEVGRGVTEDLVVNPEVKHPVKTEILHKMQISDC